MSRLTHALLRRETPQARQLANQLWKAAQWDGGHGLVWTLFSEDPDAPRDFLYREVATGEFLIVSEREPQGEPAVWTLRSRPYDPVLARGGRFGFLLRANPTVSLSQPGRARSHRADVLMHAKQAKGAPLSPVEIQDVALSWLFEREGRLGVTFDRDQCSAGPQGQMRLPRDGKPLALTMVDYAGVLTVTQPEALGAALKAGVGRGKAFGLGLLLLRHLEG